MVLLDIKNLTLEIDISGSWVKALDKINMVIHEKQIHALVGESGSGKSLIVKAIVGALPVRWRITADRMTWKGQNLLTMTVKARRKIIRKDISVIFQNPINSLDPLLTLGQQLQEMLPTDNLTKTWFWQRNKQKRELAINLLHKVGIKNHQLCLSSYPHQIPNDVVQKFMIAMALASEPKLIIADDPTRGMEVTAKTQILKLLSRVNQVKSTSVLFVSHDLLAISNMASYMTVLYCGQTVESGDLLQLRKRAFHPYTQALLNSAPSFRKDLPPKSPLSSLDGTIPTLHNLPIGCRLGPRCPRARRECVAIPQIRRVHTHFYSCHFPLHWEAK
ncbi:oligopeptide/dipeptide ABC transporter ATP-binding protein [Paraglaciecola arctica]|uniref:oligopeptide/dipeptide ABC transporter ATP-binding protein n=1 Tax=Paraglaciecola arctica TaxID=1128911 RepID=UPI001C069F6E|nr:oligopeptide/dipeptide ABC transporter ATP-binding protein [Paraglaciecola arctica]MBU3003288.1 ATP-binding cassette domain-containing protein [Paraglaciecola arctica]